MKEVINEVAESLIHKERIRVKHVTDEYAKNQTSTRRNADNKIL